MSDQDAKPDQNDQRDAAQDDQTHSDQKPTSSKDDTLAKVSEERRQARERAQKAEARLAELEAAQRDANEAKAKEEGKYKDLLEAREQELATLKAQIADRDLKDRKTAIAKAAGLPDDLAFRLQGETDDDLEADAKALAKHLKAQEAPDTDAGKRTPPGQKKPDKSDFSNPVKWGLRAN